MNGRTIAAATALLMLAVSGAVAAPPTDRILPANQYTTDKARALGAAHTRALEELNAGIYHCWPWVEIQKSSIGFYRPKGATQDERYLSIRIFIEQEPSPGFAKLKVEERATAMFSRYTGPLLRRMTKDQSVAADAKLDGFTTILEWMKPAAAVGGRPVHETIAVFIDKATALDYVAGRSDIKTLTAKARVLGFDGETPLGTLALGPTWDDNFVSTFKVANYQLEPGVTCP